MNNNQTVEKLRKMRINAMADLHQQTVRNNQLDNTTADEYIGLLTDHEWEDRQYKKINRLQKQARFKEKSSIADISYTENRNLDKNMFERLATLDFMKRAENLIITGPSGVGKSFIAQALGNQACLTGYKVLYTNTARYFTKLKLAKIDGTYMKELQKLLKIDLVIFDDFGL